MGWIKAPKDFWSGVVFMTFGAIALAVSSGYRMGTAARMGPGYFPRVLGMLLIVLGAIIALRATRTKGGPVPPFRGGRCVRAGHRRLFGGIRGARRRRDLDCNPHLRRERGEPRVPPEGSLVAGVLLACRVAPVFIVGLQLQLPSGPANDKDRTWSLRSPRHRLRRRARRRSTWPMRSSGRCSERDRRAAWHRPRGDDPMLLPTTYRAAAGVGADHAGRHLLRRAIRRVDDRDPRQHAGRDLVGRHLPRTNEVRGTWPSSSVGQHFHHDFQVNVLAEIYLNEDELR